MDCLRWIVTILIATGLRTEFRTQDYPNTELNCKPLYGDVHSEVELKMK